MSLQQRGGQEGALKGNASEVQHSEVQQSRQPGLKVPRYFTKEGRSPFDLFKYEKRVSSIKNPDGSLVFHMEDVEVPDFWSQLATDILAQKYFRKAGVPLNNELGQPLLDENGKRITGSETSIRQVAHRIAGCWRWWGEKYGYFVSQADAQAFYDEMAYMITAQVAAPNSPQWFTTGLNFAYGLSGPAQGHSYVDPVTEKLEYSKDSYSRSQPHACFIQSVRDDLVTGGGIFDLLTREARVFKFGSGTGSNFSNLRAKGERLSGGGTSSGLMSFLKIFDAAAGSIKSGGTTRRAAKMVCLDLDHPEIEDFIWWKVREEEKVASLVAGSKVLNQRLGEILRVARDSARRGESLLQDAEMRKLLREAYLANVPLNYLVRTLDLAAQGYEMPLKEFDTHYESEAYLTVAGQNSNNSVRIPNSFFEKLHTKGNWQLRARTSREVLKEIPAEKIWDDIAYCAWASADPGVQYDTTTNEWHTCPEDGSINASNPCGEYNFLDDTACNLASINLVKFYNEKTGSFDVSGYRHAIRLWTIALEISVLMAQFPSEEIAIKSHEFRTLGLGYANLGTLLMLQGIPYDSDRARATAGALAAIMTGDAYGASAELAAALGPFKRYERNKEHMLRVIRNHRRAAYDERDYESLTVTPHPLNQELCPGELLGAAQDSWDRALELGKKYGYRNAQATVIAPTGTIALVMSCDTTGIEPDYAVVKFKKLAGGGYFKIVNYAVTKALQRLGYSSEQIEKMLAYCLGHGTLQGCPQINFETLKARGLTEGQLQEVEKGLRSAMDISFAFNTWTLGQEFYDRVMQGFAQKIAGAGARGKSKGTAGGPGVSGSGAGKPANFLEALGFTREQIGEANEYVCGTMTLEGALHLKEEHLPVFDCANTCGSKGKRHIHPYGHLKMVAAVQPFISGAISKTVNMPHNWTVSQIRQAYYDAWTMMIKAVALYRDGCKLSQPLNATLEQHAELQKLLSDASDAEEPRLEKELSPAGETGRLDLAGESGRLSSAGGLSSARGLSPVRDVKKVIRLGQRELEIAGRVAGNRLLRVSARMPGMTPVQEALTTALVSSVNLSLAQGANPMLIAAHSLQAEGHPVIRELRSFLEEFGANDFVAGGLEANPSKENYSKAHLDDLDNLDEKGVGTGRLDEMGVGAGRGPEPGRGVEAESGLVPGRAAEAGSGINIKRIKDETEKCSGCGATQLRPNGACMLCEVCGETSGCS